MTHSSSIPTAIPGATSSAPLNICLVHGREAFVRYFRSQGHNVLNLRPDTLLFNLPGALEEADFRPDMVVQLERLGRRTLVSGLEQVDCPKAFWSLDTHLNLYWHRWYGRLFDLVLTTQRAWMDRLRRGGLKKVEWLPWFGERRPFVPHARRERDLAFVGRVTPHRPARVWFAEFLAGQYGVSPVENLSFQDMMQYYATSRIVPNETIFGEVNFRLFEGASCGCVVLNPDISDELADLFEPGVEMDVFDHVLDLKFLLECHLKDPERCMKMGLAAWERVQREHLPEHRAEKMLELVPGAERVAASGREARTSFALALFSLWEAGRMELEETYLLDLLKECGPDADVLGARLRALSAMGRVSELEALAAEYHSTVAPGILKVDSLSSAAALKLKRWDMAKLFWYRFQEASGEPTPQKPGSPAELYRLWARELQREGESMRVGFVLRESEHLPMTATEFLLMGLQADRDDLETHARLEQIMSGVHGCEPPRMGFLSHLALHHPANWRTGLELALAQLSVFRMNEGLTDLLLARDSAEEQDQLDRFLRILKARDKGGLLLRAVAS